MSRPVIFKTIKTYAHKYVYDRHTNSIVRLTEDEYNELTQVEKGELAGEQSQVIKKYQESGLFVPNVVEKIEHPATAIIEQYMDTRMKQLTLQVTQQCNLRCEYCSYSGIYSGNRTHSSKRMSFETAKDAIDFFLKRSSALTEGTIGFYGGEPLLEFELIKQCVEYAKSCVEGKKITFNMTTNGTLLTDAVVDYLADNDFSLAISVDGSKEEHDVNRKFVNGAGSFDTIMDNIKRIRSRRPEFDKNIFFMTTVNPYMDLGCVLEYFSTDEIFSDRQIMFNTMNELGLGQELPYDEKYFRVRNYEYIKMLLALVGKLDMKYVSPLAASSRDKKKQNLRHLRSHSELAPTVHHNGPCMPGLQRLFVRTDGALFPCERVNHELDYFKIGMLEGGLDMGKMKAILNIGQVTETECKTCWNLKHCSICAGQIEFETEPTKSCKLVQCAQNEANAFSELNELCILSEFGIDVEMEVLT